LGRRGVVAVLFAGMSRVGSNELPGSMATLGLVIDTPDTTVSEYKKALSSRFRRARFAPSTANNTLPRLAAEGKVRRTFKASSKARSKDRYTYTPKGIKAFRDWMYDLDMDGIIAVGMPAMRDGTYGRIEFCDPLQDPALLPHLIERARAEQQVSTDLYEQATRRLRTHMSNTDPLDFKAKVRGVPLYADPLHWSGRAERYAQIARRFEEIQREVEQYLAEMAS
jgi:DNA-binding PadR family transcriptional regulator